MASSFAARFATFDDVAALAALERAADVAWWGKAETEDADVRHGLEWAGDLASRTQVLERGGDMVGFAARMGEGDAGLSVAPWLDEPARQAAYDELLGWLEAAGARELDAPRQDRARLAALERHGFMPVRSSFELEMRADAPLPEPRWPERVAVRPFELERDAPVLHELVYSVWADVAGHHDRPFDEWRHAFLGHDGFDPGLQVLTWRGDQLVGAAVCRVYGDTDGWLSQLVVARDARGLGLGRALLCEALRRLAAVPGVELLGLSVMARNQAALGLYQSVGLRVDREFITCERGDNSSVRERV
ncbi:MAG: GNAT family N-acetyltransferase [Euzebyales bacterium]|nr:GNAT family N-acetyltransferase [Euzebyales bacterium]